MQQIELDLTARPGVTPCDCCERIVPCEWFGCFTLCDNCRPRAIDAIGLEAGGRAIQRLALLHQAEARIEELIERVGDPGLCKGCGAQIYWIRHRATEDRPQGAIAPYNITGINHFATCPSRGQFHKRGRNG